ncbi:MAG: HAD hydrolase family protein [Dehalococcoidia bacterium]|jgi:predicted HAD superfamily phosphohydrolase
MNLIFFDMEGPLSIHDNMRALMKLIPNGNAIFEVVRRYDRQRTYEEEDAYDPGDDLSVLAPFIIHNGITSNDIAKLADEATIVDGAKELIESLSGWQVFCISTAYEQYAARIMQRVGITRENLECTLFPLERIKSLATKEDYSRIAAFENEMLNMQNIDDKHVKLRFEGFFRKELAQTAFGKAVREIKPMGGRKKAAALRNVARLRGVFPEQCVVIGDSITDSRMLETVHLPGGLAIAFNGSEHALAYATMGLASTDIRDIKPALDAWAQGSREAVKQFVESQKGRGKFQWLADADSLEEPLKIHLGIRQQVRRAAGLG